MKNSFLFTILFIIFNFSCEKDRNGFVDITSKADDKNAVKKFNFYENGKLKKTLEYINVCGKEYLNQGWHFNQTGDTIEKKSHYYKIKIERNFLKQLEKTKVTMNYKPLFKNSASAILLCQENNINYCELEHKKFDTVYFFKNRLDLNMGFKNRGKVKVTGYILEINSTEGGNYENRKVYFTLNFNVK